MSGILAGMFERRYHVKQEPPGWIVEGMPGWTTATGLGLSPDKALEATAVLACVRVLAESVAMLPLPVYRRLDDGGKQRAPDHYLYPLLHTAPNPEMTSFTFRETLMGHVLTWGNGYAEVEFNRGGGINALWPLRPDKMKVTREGGRLQYKYTLPKKFGEEIKTLDAGQILHVRGLGFDGLMGYSPISLAKQAIGMVLATEEFGARFFGNGARPGMVLKHPGELEDTDYKRLKDSWAARYQGLENAHRVAILEEGMEIQEIGIPPEDAQFLETRKFQLNEIARMYRVPPHMIGDLERATFSNIEQQSLEFVNYSLMPWLVRWEQEISLRLFTAAERERLFVEFLVAGLLRGDITSRYTAYATSRQWGWMSANDVRRLENMNPIPDGDIYMMPLNMVPASQAGLDHARNQTRLSDSPTGGLGGQTRGEAQTLRAQWLAGTATRQRDAEHGGKQRAAQARLLTAKSYQRVFLEGAKRAIKRESQDVMSRAKKVLARGNQAEFELWLAEFYADFPQVLEGMWSAGFFSLSEAINAAAATEVNGPVGMTPGLDECVQYHVERSAARHANLSQLGILKALQEAGSQGDDAVVALEQLLQGWETGNRALNFAHWEVVRTSNLIAKATWFFAGMPGLEWVQLDANPFCATLDGMVTMMGNSCRGSFFVGKDEEVTSRAERSKTLSPSWNVATPPLFLGCECQIVPVAK